MVWLGALSLIMSPRHFAPHIQYALATCKIAMLASQLDGRFDLKSGYLCKIYEPWSR